MYNSSRGGERVFEMPPSSSGLGHWPFKPEAGVRIPLGAPNKGWERSSVGERLPYKQEVVGSSPAAPTTRMKWEVNVWPGSSVGRALD